MNKYKFEIFFLARKKPQLVINFSEINKPAGRKVRINFDLIKIFLNEFSQVIKNYHFTEPRLRLEKLTNYGRELFRYLILPLNINLPPNSILIFSIDKELINIPFEIIYDTQFWCLKYEIIRQVRIDHPVHYSKKIKKIKAVIFSNPDEDSKLEESLKMEREEIFKLLKSSNIAVAPPYCGRIITKEFFIKKLLENNIVYFSGHSVSLNKGKDYLKLYRQKLYVRDIRNINFSNIKLLFINSCQSSINKILYTFIKSGVRNYIGSAYHIKPEPAKDFAVKFFKSILRNKRFSFAIRKARKEIFKKYKFKTVAWFAFNFYGNFEEKLKEKKQNKKLKVIIAGIIFALLFWIIYRYINFRKKETLAILPFDYFDPELKNVVMKLTDFFYERYKDKYTLIEREKIDEIIKELKFTQSGFIDKEKAIRIGNLISARYMLLGRVYKRGNKLIIYYRIVDVETGRIFDIKKESYLLKQF